MRHFRQRTTSTLLWLFWATVAYSQQPQPTAVPKLVRFSGSFRPAMGLPAQAMESVTLSVYADNVGGDALWHEIQNAVVDADGHYSILMGATQNEGMPLDLFASGEPRWLGVQFNRPGEAEQPRVLMVSVPYALKASDAETLGGRPASAYVLSGAPAGTAAGSDHPAVPSATSTKATVKPKATSGLPNYIGKFANGTDLVDSAIYEANGNVGIFTTQPAIALDVRTGPLPQMGIAGLTDYLTFFASDVYGPAIYWDPAKDMRFGKGGASLYNPFGFVEYMRIKSSNGNVGVGTSAPGSKLDVAGDINFSGNVRYQGSQVLRVSGLNNSNLALGPGALANTTGSFNTASGTAALGSNTSGGNNTASGYASLFSNTLGSFNTASGEHAMNQNTTGNNNTGTGFAALLLNTTGYDNTATGYEALYQNTSGVGNTASGLNALFHNTTGSYNIAIGYQAATNINGANNYNIDIGSGGFPGDVGAVRIGSPGQQTSFFVTGVRGKQTGASDTVPVLIDSQGQLGTVNSSRRFKEDIEDMGVASHNLMRLRPVTFRYKQPFADGAKPMQFGLIAEEVAEVYPDLVVHSADGQIETVKYQVLDSMLLNEVQRQQAEIAAQKDHLRRLEQQINEQHGQNHSLQERLARLEAALPSASGESRVSSARSLY